MWYSVSIYFKTVVPRFCCWFRIFGVSQVINVIYWLSPKTLQVGNKLGVAWIYRLEVFSRL